MELIPVVAAAWLSLHGCHAAGPSRTTASVCAHPLADLPGGWVWLPQTGTDSSPGAYHDRLSGALLRFDGVPVARIDAVSGHQPPSTDRRTDGILGGIPYTLELIPNVREYLLEQGKRRWGNDYPKNIPGAEEALPVPAAHRLTVTFRGRVMEWRFTSDLDTDQQESRVRQLLLASRSGPCDAIPTALPGKGIIADPAGARVKEGDSVAKVIGELGAPHTVKGVGRNEFILRYDVRHPDGDVPMDLHFDQQQTLMRWPPSQGGSAVRNK